MKKMEQYTDFVLEYLEGLRRVIIDSKNHFRSIFEKYGIKESYDLG